MKRLTEEFKEKLQEKIQSFEKTTSIELVPVVVAQSDSYFWPRLFYSLLYSIICFFILEHFVHFREVWHLAIVALLGGVFFGLLSFGTILRFVLPDVLLLKKVEQKALDAFCVEEVFATKARTGALVLVSLLEHKVFVLADKGLSGHVPKEKWQEMGQKLAEDFSEHNPGQSFFTALDLLVKDVSEHFPPCADNPNELPNTLRIK